MLLPLNSSNQVVFAHKKDNVDDTVRFLFCLCSAWVLLVFCLCRCAEHPAFQLQDIFEEDEDEVSLDDPRAFYKDFCAVNHSDAEVKAACVEPFPM